MTVSAVIQARMGSSRFPGKVLRDLCGRPILDWVVCAAREIPGVDTVVVATSDAEINDPIRTWCSDNAVRVFNGSEEDVVSRISAAAASVGAHTVLRLTADCPLLDPQICGAVLALLTRENLDYANNTDPPQWPDGLDCEAVRADMLAVACNEAVLPSEREHVTPFIRKRRDRFKIGYVPCPLPGLGAHRWTVDNEDDLIFIHKILAKLPEMERAPSYLDILKILEGNPDIDRNDVPTHRGPAFTIGSDKKRAQEFVNAERRFDATNDMLARASRSIPLASQTFSKSGLQFPVGQSPLFLSHGQGGRVVDVDGNEYVDLMSGLHTVLLGYRDPDVDRAITNQLSAGISFSLSTALEADLAERLIEMIPSAQQVRFGKNGSDVTSAAIRLARAFTKRDHVIACGYHGWQDWYIGSTTRNKGVPGAVRALTHRAPYNDLGAINNLFEENKDNVAAVILEPMTGEEPRNGYLVELQSIVRRHGAILIFDEIITGFRFAAGGAQEYFGVTPDLSTFGKGMGNGMPISAVVGREDIMHEMEEIFFSATFGGETLSIAAAIAVIDKIQREPVIETIWESGSKLAEDVAHIIQRYGLDSVLTLHGKAPWKILHIADHPKAPSCVIQTLFKREMLDNGVLIGGGHNINFAHHESDIDTILLAYEKTLSVLARELESDGLENRMNCAIIRPVFAVRG